MKYLLVSFLLLFSFKGISQNIPSTSSQYDVVVVGGTAAGIASAINAARKGAKVVLTERTSHLGGLATGGLSNTDFITYESLGGTWREFMDRVVEHYEETYGPNSSQVKNSMDGGYYEPRVGLMVFREMLDEYKDNIQILLKHRLEFVETEMKPNSKSKVEAVWVKDLNTDQIKAFEGKIFIDATYEGDLMAKAGVEYVVGSEARSEYDESLESKNANWHVQCYNFRPVLSNDPENQLPISKPEGYDREVYAPLIEVIEKEGFNDLSQIIQDDRPLPNNKGDFNDEKGSPISMHVCNPTDVWPEGNPRTRKMIFEYIKKHNQGFLYFLQNDPQLPEWVRKDMGQWGLPKDEFEEYGHWPPVVYVREGRRMVGEYVFTQHDAQPNENSVRSPARLSAVAIGDYGLNSHGTHEPEPGVLKGEIGGSVRPWQVPYEVMLPKKVDGLLVPVAVSASRVGYGAIRMEPTWTALGQAAGLAAAQAINNNKEVRNIEIPELQIQLHNLDAKTFYVTDVSPSSKYFNAVQYLGNRGFFQELYEPAEATNWEQEDIPGPPSHFNTAVPYHDVQPSKEMTKELAKYWLEMADIEDKSSFQQSFDKYSRGEFLNKIYNKLR